MTVDPSTLDDALQAFESFLRDKRLKMTEQRRTMIRAALMQRGHFTAEDLHTRLRSEDEPVSMATVYRGLALLEEAELVEAHDFADGQRRYERSHDREHHDHMVCVDCRAVVEFTNEQIERIQQRVVEEHDFTLKEHALTLFVTCNALRDSGTCERRDERQVRAAERRGH